MSLYGSHLEVRGVYPTLESTIFGPYEVSPERGPDDFEFIALGGIDEVWDVTANRIHIEFTETIRASGGEYNAWLITDLRDSLPDISKVRIVAANTTAAWDDSMIEWTEDSIIINYTKNRSGVSVTSGQTLELRVVFDALSGSNRRDVIEGTGKRDTLYGLRGRDDIDGKGGSDKIDGGRGSDTLNGGRGADKFVFRANSGNDVIEDFQDGRDRIILRGWDADKFQLLDIDADAGSVIVSSGDNSITLLDTDVSVLDSSDFLFR